MRAPPVLGPTTAPLACSRQTKSDDDWLPLYGFEAGFSKTDYTGDHILRNADIHDEHMVLAMMNELVEQGHQLGMSPSRQPALEHGELKPFAIAVHYIVDGAPALRVTDVIGDDVQMIIHPNYRVMKPGNVLMSRNR